MANTVATPSTLATTKGSTSSSAQGRTVISDAVVAKVAGIAASQVPGVHALGGGAARAIGALRGALNQADHGQGISVEVGETQVAADVQVVAEYPVSLQAVADDVRAAVVDAIENLVGMDVTEVNVNINDVFIPSEDKGDESAEARVQ